MRRWVDQSRYDASIPDEMLERFEAQLRSKLEIKSRRLDLAALYSRLLTEWMDSPTGPNEEPASHDSSASEDSFEFVERQRERLQQLCDQFESVVFEPLHTDEVEIDNYMQQLFAGDVGAKALEQLRRDVGRRGKDMLAAFAPFNHKTLSWCINGLLAEDLLSDEKKSILQDLLQNEVVLSEIADVLNMRFADIENWAWHAGDDGIPVMPRQQLNGKYRIWMDEDVLQAIFVHYIGITWCVSMKSILQNLIGTPFFWNWNHGGIVPEHDLSRRQYFLSERPLVTASVETERERIYRKTFFLSQLPSSIKAFNAGGGYDNDGGDDRKSDSPNTKQQLLRQLATEVLLRRSVDHEVAVVQSDLKWYATALPHSTIFAVMRFVGFSEGWIQFFKRYLEAPLDMRPSSEGKSASEGSRIRKRGVPMAHAPEKLLGELVLFIMDLAVNQETGMLLYRLHDDLWLCGQPKKCAKAWQTMQDFAKVMGLEFNKHKTGSVYLTTGGKKPDTGTLAVLPKGDVSIGFLTLDPSSGQWMIDQGQVEAHLKQLQKQLAACNSVLSWVQTWNSCIGRFFNHTFGQPANCFGRQHVDSTLETHNRIQRTLFDGKDGKGRSVTDYLKGLISSRFGVTDVPDAFLFIPEQLGGLGLRNPFVSLFLVREQLFKNPEQHMQAFFVDEKKEYAAAKKAFDELDKQGRRRRYHQVYADDFVPGSRLVQVEDSPDSFMSMEEFIKWREARSSRLYSTYVELMSVPAQEEIALLPAVIDTLNTLAITEPDLSLSKLNPERKWIIQLHSSELFERCGELSLVDKAFLPLGVLTMMRRRKVTWQMVL
ncbi:hypothetical protein H2201_008491 [Coniosporium apollinis]|uniref:Reverse transcriptase domain-containing protein n=1 Tax=Coniosporium apollinis TaxID=61459 RepID=A0ABQ9NI08_9PEZI|nr:hypothetical protein H2201_008491 [Coniosporium apollinis]